MIENCLIWNKGLDKEGYAIATVEGRQVRVARLILTKKLGRSLEDKEVTRHLCHNKACIRPSHLAPGSNYDNFLDSYRAGRRRRDEKLSDTDVLEIRELRAAGVTCAAVAKRFKLSTSTVSYIERGLRKKHVVSVRESRE